MSTVTKAKPMTKKTRRRIKPRKEVVSIRLDRTIRQRADQLAKADKRSCSQYVELAVEQYMKEQQALTTYFQPSVVYPIFTPYGEEAAAEKLTELLNGRSA